MNSVEADEILGRAQSINENLGLLVNNSGRLTRKAAMDLRVSFSGLIVGGAILAIGDFAHNEQHLSLLMSCLSLSSLSSVFTLRNLSKREMVLRDTDSLLLRYGSLEPKLRQVKEFLNNQRPTPE